MPKAVEQTPKPKFKDKYTNSVLGEQGKLEITHEAYAIGEILQEIFDSLENQRKWH